MRHHSLSADGLWTRITPDLESVTAETDGRATVVRGQARFHTLHARLRWAHRRCRDRVARPGRALPDEPAETVMHSHIALAVDPPIRAKVADALRRAQLQTPRGVERIAIAQRTASGRAPHPGRSPAVIESGTYQRRFVPLCRWPRAGVEHRPERPLRDPGGAAYSFRGPGLGARRGSVPARRRRDGRRGAARTMRSWRSTIPGTVVGLTGRGFKWQRLGGDTLSLLTTVPARSRGARAGGARSCKVCRSAPI